jgi:hypothetical protein
MAVVNSPHHLISCGWLGVELSDNACTKEIEMFSKNSEGNYCVETTMGTVRSFTGWQDELNIADDAFVVVCEDGAVSCAETGDRIESVGFQSVEIEDEWREYWDFDGFSKISLGDLSSPWGEGMEKYEGNIAII